MKETISKNSRPRMFHFLRSESASSTVVGAVLLLGIVVTIFAVVRLGYIPEWKNDAEYSHMNDVWENMADLKSKTDMMTIVLASDAEDLNYNTSSLNSSTSKITMSVPFEMGGGDAPLIGPIKSTGTLSVNKDKCVMSIIAYEGADSVPKSVSCGTITYTSQNRYYVDQVYSYENGALILSQGDHSVMMLHPSIRFSRISAQDYNVSINAVEIPRNPYAPPDIISSNTGCSLLLDGLYYKPVYDSDRNNFGNIDYFILTVYTKYPEAWEAYLNETADAAGLEPDIDYNIESNAESGSVRLTFPYIDPDAKEPTSTGLKRLYISKTVIKAEPGIGLN